MADTPLHEHEAVKHLMGTEHWPTDTDENGQRCRLSWEVVDDDGRRGWCFLRNQGAVLREVSNNLAHSLITLAAVRGIMARGYSMLTHEHIGSGKEWWTCILGPGLRGDFCPAQMPNGPTELLAILAAYQATVMEGGK